MNQDAQQKITEIAARLSHYEVEELESRFEMSLIPSSTCTSECGTGDGEAK